MKVLELCAGSRRTKIKSGIKADVAKFKGKVENFTSGVFHRVQSYRSNNSDYVPRLEGSLENHPASGQYSYCSRDRCLLNPRAMTITRSYCCHGVRRMQNLIEFVQGTARRVAFAYRRLNSIAFISHCSSKVVRECFIGETTSR